MSFFKTPSVLLIILLSFAGVIAQRNGTVQGVVKTEFNERLEGCVVTISELDLTTRTDTNGAFRFTLPVGDHVLAINSEGFRQVKYQVRVRPAATEVIYIVMKTGGIGEVVIYGTDDPKGLPPPDNFQIFPIATDKISEMPTFKADVESKIVTLPGVQANNEFSSQYRVRGGNFDENLIYVNDILIYRPFLVRSGQQEGLGFVNPNLTQNISFSTGGFGAKYGDKMSSVLDVTYKDPHHLHGTAELGLLNQNFHIEGSSKNKVDTTDPGRFTYLFGARRFSPSYLLNSLDVQGNYQPTFVDAQGLFGWSPKQKEKPMRIRERKNGKKDTLYFPSQRLKFQAFLNVASNRYRFIPEARETQFGTVQSVFRLQVAFEGREIMSYLTGLGAFVAEHRPNSRLKIKYIVSGFRTQEAEEFDVEGGYRLSDVNTNFGDEGFNEVVFDRSIGTNFRHGRNFLNAYVLSAAQRGDWYPGKRFKHQISWGLRYQKQLIEDELTEWTGVDSAGYFTLDESFRTKANLNSNLYKVYLQDNWKLGKKGTHRLIFGSRAVFNDLNNQFFVSPRVSYVFDPSLSRPDRTDTLAYEKWKKRQVQFRLSTGVYQQPAFYREMRRFDGTVNTDVKAQTAYHFIAGVDYLFKIWNRPFKLFAEAYYKHLENLVPYEIDNVRLRYYPDNQTNGYATGLDIKVNGEFIRGVDSWMSLSLLQTRENIPGGRFLAANGELKEQDMVPRPTDQRFAFSMYFQDELPINPTYKVNINFVYGSGMRIGPPRNFEQRTLFRVPAYNRVDLGFSKVFLFRGIEEEDDGFGINSLWVSVEVYNLFQRSNTVSYTWIKDVFNTQFAVPNFLSARLLTARVIARF